MSDKSCLGYVGKARVRPSYSAKCLVCHEQNNIYYGEHEYSIYVCEKCTKAILFVRKLMEEQDAD